ncbi:MAG TPA: HEAT repeat domain-containing protein [Terriglobales bacterium]|nr:HEAT repeat domain-containing protein [Terriglobales bacterium]
MSDLSQLDSARAFTRSLNILLKYVRLYGPEHLRTTVQLATTWQELESATGEGQPLLLGTAEGKLVMDGIPIAGLAESRFAELLQAAGIASIQINPGVSESELKLFASAFTTTTASEIPKQVKAALGSRSSIQLNEVRFVAQDPTADVAGQIAAKTLSPEAGKLAAWVSDPEKLLQLITAAEGARAGGDGAPGSGSGSGAGPGGSGTGLSGDAIISDKTLACAVRVLTQFAEAGEEGPSPEFLKQATAEAPDVGRVLRAAMASLPEAAEEEDPHSPPLVKLAERLAIRYAMQQYQRGEVKVNAVHDMMERMSKEIDSLRTILTSHERKMNRAGMAVESHADILDRQFWASVPERGKQMVLLSADAYCIPARNVRSYVEELMARGDVAMASRVLRSYAAGIDHPEEEARKKVSSGLQELADLYGRVEADLLRETLARVGMRVCCEHTLDMQTLVSAAYVRLTQEAAQRRDYLALTTSLKTLERLHEYRPRSVEHIRPRIAVEHRLHEFVAEAANAPLMPAGILELLRLTPRATAETIAMQFSRCHTRSDGERLLNLAQQAGDNIMECLQSMLRSGSADETARGAAILSRIKLDMVQGELAQRISSFNRLQQDAIVRQVAAAGAVGRGKLLLELLEELDPLILPEALDEIGLAGDPVAAGALLELAEGEGRAKNEPYIRLKSIEALGRLREPSATDTLLKILEPPKFFSLGRPRELRLTATQALLQIDPERADDLVKSTGFSRQELLLGPLPIMGASDFLRQRRYPRVVAPEGFSALATTANARCNVAVERISLGGGLLSRNSRVPRCGEATMEMQFGLQRLRSRVLLRDLPTREVAYEILNMDLDGRGKLRKLLLNQCPEPALAAAQTYPSAASSASIS